jgi:hypothetical protein
LVFTPELVMPGRRTWISAFILLILALHALPVLSYQRNRQTRWPFLTWTMYAKSYPPGPIESVKRKVMARTASGRTDELTARIIGMRGPALGTWFVRPMWAGDSAAARELLDRVNRGRQDPYIEIWIEGQRYTLLESGIAEQDIRGPVFRFGPASRERN